MSRVIAAFAQFFDGSGDPLENGWLKFLVSDTNNTLKNTYADANQSIPNTNPIQLDAEGRCPNVFGQGTYRVILFADDPVTHSPGTMLQTFDPVVADYVSEGAGGNFAEWDINTLYQVGQIVIYNSLYYRSFIANNIGNAPDVSPTYWERIDFVRYWNTNVTYLADELVLYDAQLWFSLASANQGNQPDISPTWWDLVGDFDPTYLENGIAANAANIATNTADIATNAADILTNAGNISTNASGISTNASNLATHIADLANPHSVTATQVGLGNVTNDAQLKRADSDFLTFTETTTPDVADIVLMETAAGTKRKLQLGNLPSNAASPEQDIYGDILGGSKYEFGTFDDFKDESLTDAANTDMTHDPNNSKYTFTAAEQVQSDDLFDSNSGLTEVTEALIEILYTDSGTPTVQATADGTNWETVTPGEIHTFTNTGIVLKLRFIGGGTGEVTSWGIFYKENTEEIVEPNNFVRWDELRTFRNKIINGNFDIWQRGTSLTGTGYLADRWGTFDGTSGSISSSQQSFTVGQTEVPNNPLFFLRFNVLTATVGGNPGPYNRIEGVHTLAGKTVTLSFWAKANTAITVTPFIRQYFGTTGSASVAVDGDSINVTTSWQKFTQTFSVPSISGKTVDTSDDHLHIQFRMPYTGTFSFDIAQVQLEEGGNATPFEVRPIGYELQLCQRYYQKSYELDQAPGTSGLSTNGFGFIPSSTRTGQPNAGFSFFQPMRDVPTVVIYSTNTGASGYIYDFNASGDVAVSSTTVGECGVFEMNFAGAHVVGNRNYWHWTADAEL